MGKHYLWAVALIVGACGAAPPEESSAPARPVELTEAFKKVVGPDGPGLLARVPLGPNHAFDIYEHGSAVGYAEVGGPGVRPTQLLGALDGLSPRDVFELLAPGRALPAGLERYPRTNAPKPALAAELVQQARIVHEELANMASTGPCPWEFFRDTTTSLGPLCIPQGTPYEDARCWFQAGWADVRKPHNKRAMAAICPVSGWKTFQVFVNAYNNEPPDRMFLVGSGWWTQYKVTGNCDPWWGTTCHRPTVQFKMLENQDTAHFSYGYDGWPGG